MSGEFRAFKSKIWQIGFKSCE